jgi:type II secretory pathway pseudopilin PulG
VTARGFTLIEIVLVGVVLSLLVLVSVPGFQRTAQRLRVEHTAFEFAQLARLARERAVDEARAMVWTWDAERQRARIEPADAAAGGGNGAGPSDRLESGPLPAGIAVTLLQDGEEVECRCAQFFPEGTAEAAIVTLESGPQMYRMVIDAATGQTVVAAGAAPR